MTRLLWRGPAISPNDRHRRKADRLIMAGAGRERTGGFGRSKDRDGHSRPPSIGAKLAAHCEIACRLQLSRVLHGGSASVHVALIANWHDFFRRYVTPMAMALRKIFSDRRASGFDPEALIRVWLACDDIAKGRGDDDFGVAVVSVGGNSRRNDDSHSCRSLWNPGFPRRRGSARKGRAG